VLAVGPGTSNDKGGYDPLPVKPGDVVLFSAQSGLELTDALQEQLSEHGITDDDAKKVLLLRFVDLVARVKPVSSK
jgi:co-chaperonin GroES (HSP10)